MARALADPVALASRRTPRGSPLGTPHFVVLLAGVLLVPLVILFLIYPWSLDFLTKDAARARAAAFGFDVGGVLTDDGDTTWGITDVIPGGLAERAGLRVGDVIETAYGTSGGFLLGALQAAARGDYGCLDVRNMPARRAGLRLDRTVCLGAPLAAEPLEPTCPLPSTRGVCPAPTGGASLVWREPVQENGRHALVLRQSEGPEVLVRAFDRCVEILWAPDGQAVAITERDARGMSNVWVHWGPLLSRQTDLAASIAATGTYFGDRRIVNPPRWEDASTLRLLVGRPDDAMPVPTTLRFRYRLGAAAPTPVP